MQNESYLQTITASSRSRRNRAGLAAKRLKRKVRVRLGRSQKREASPVKTKILVLLAAVLVCAIYGVVFVMSQTSDPTPNVTTGPRGIATFFQKF